MTDETRNDDAAPEGVATEQENARLEHSQGGTTTRDDALDAGVPMEQGDPAEPQGPEDALGRGEKRGDYRDRIPGAPMESVPVEGGGEPVTRWVDRETGAAAKEGAKGAVEVQVDVAPSARLEAQKPRAEEIGNSEPTAKGGVTTEGNATAGV